MILDEKKGKKKRRKAINNRKDANELIGFAGSQPRKSNGIPLALRYAAFSTIGASLYFLITRRFPIRREGASS